VRLIYMGTPAFALAPLRALTASRHQVVAVVTGQDKPAGRGRQLRPTAVKELATSLGTPVLTPVKLGDAAFVESLRKFDADAFVIIAFRVLPESVFAVPRHGAINAHASLLPRYRGAAPINWAIMNGETETGVTTFRIQRSVDTGDMLLQEKTPIGASESASELSARLSEMAARLVARTLDGLEDGTLKSQPQDGTQATPAPKLTRETQVIDWTRPAHAIFNQVRGLAETPSAVTGFRGSAIKILAVSPVAKNNPSAPLANLAPGEIIVERGCVVVGTGDGTLSLARVRPMAKSDMSGQDFSNGYRLRSGERFMTPPGDVIETVS